MVGSRRDSQQPAGSIVTSLSHDRFCDEVIAQTRLLRDVVAGADLSVTVPTTPDWTLAQLLRHVGGNLRAVELAVRSGEAVTEPERQVPDHAGPDGGDPAALDAWLAESADRMAATLREAGRDLQAQVWVVRWPTGTWARRAAHDALVHRADAAGAVGAGFPVAPDLAAAALDAEWLVEVGPSGFTWRRGHEKATVAVRAPLADLLRVVTRRLSPDTAGVEVLGDRQLLAAWLERLRLQ